MPSHSRLAIFAHVLLPLALVLASVAGLGSYYETNDDGLFTLLLRGQAASAPVADLHLYFHGFAWLWASLYTRWPGLPWFGLTLYALLLLAFTLLFVVLDRAARPRLRPGGRVVLLAGFYFIALLETVYWFNYSRVPLLLAGAGLLYALQRANGPALVRRWALLVGLGVVVVAGLLRPSMALLGLLAVVPAAAWLPADSPGEDSDGRQFVGPRWWPFAPAAMRVLCWFAALVLGGTLALSLSPAPAETRYLRRLDTLLVELNDYHLRRPMPATTADTLALRGIQRWWLVADSTIFNPALFARATRLDGPHFVTQVLPGKVVASGWLLVRDYFPVLLALLFVGIEGEKARRRSTPMRWPWYWSYIGFAALLFGLAMLLKLPPRLAGPLLALFLASQIAGVLRYAVRISQRVQRLGLLFGVFVGLIYAAKTAHRVQLLRREQQLRGEFLARLQTQAGLRLVAVAGLETSLKSLSPFHNYGPARVMLLNGWPTLDPSQPHFRQLLSGHRDLSAAVHYLAADSTVLWLMPPAFVPFYNNYLAHTARLPAPGLHFQRRTASWPVADTALPVPVRPLPAPITPGRP